jgi:hypothetical protein
VRINLAIATLLSSVLLSAAQTPTVFKNLSVTGTLALPNASVAASMLASGAAKANLSAELPNLSASVQGTGQPGLNGGHWFIWNQPGSFDSTESLRVTRNIPTGLGSSGSTYKSIWGTSSNNPSSLGYEWTITGEQNTFSNATGGAQNVASNGTIRRGIPLAWASATTGASGTGTTATVTFSGGATIPVGHAVNIAGVTPSGYNGTRKVTASSPGSVSFASATTGAQTVAGTAVDTSLSYSAGMNGNCIDNTGEPDPIAPCIGAEFDVTVSSATTDVNKNRVGVQVNANGTSGMHAGRAILLGTGAGVTWDRGIDYTGSYGIGIDLSGGAYSSEALLLPSGGLITSVGDANLSASGSGTLRFGLGSTMYWSISSGSGAGLVPAADNARDIGSASNRVATAYMVNAGASGTPITNGYITNETLGAAPTWPSQTANTFWAAPDGSSGAPAMRAIVANDLPATITPSSVASSGNLSLSAGGANTLSFGLGGTTYWNISSGAGADLRPAADNARNLGSASLRVASAYAMKVLAYTSVQVQAAVPTISTCGTSPPAATAGSSNNGGQFTLGTGATAACTVTFATAFPTQAYCTVTPASNYTGTYYISAQSRTAFTVTLGTGTASVVFNYSCNGN